MLARFSERSRVKVKELQRLLELATCDYEQLGGDRADFEDEHVDGKSVNSR